MNKVCIFIVLVACCSFTSTAQLRHIKHVVCSGGDLTSTGNYTSVSVVGQLAASEFSRGSYSGSIGYLDKSDMVPNAVPLENIQNDVFRVYPNPSSGDIWVDYQARLEETLSITITDAIGKRIFEQSYDATTHHHVLLSKELFITIGMYHILAQIGGITYIEKVTILK